MGVGVTTGAGAGVGATTTGGGTSCGAFRRRLASATTANDAISATVVTAMARFDVAVLKFDLFMTTATLVVGRLDELAVDLLSTP